ncbi:hypothetical protein CYMTET_43047 [Cymbomonas tetramitiformis]|uniref:Uncharacterized protein n=1 Tax=Cymbomonas tetramitiformis TaxID=36881 RepID=A0AAE0C2Y5_9CHLO|nr:hypothetical protein CYMTET_43047 [Cymbomonas tetramitiformis]
MAELYGDISNVTGDAITFSMSPGKRIVGLRHLQHVGVQLGHGVASQVKNLSWENRKRGIKAGSPQSYLSASNNCHSNPGSGTGAGGAVTRAVKGGDSIQAEPALGKEELLDTQRTWLPASHELQGDLAQQAAGAAGDSHAEQPQELQEISRSCRSCRRLMQLQELQEILRAAAAGAAGDSPQQPQELLEIRRRSCRRFKRSSCRSCSDISHKLQELQETAAGCRSAGDLAQQLQEAAGDSPQQL